MNYENITEEQKQKELDRLTAEIKKVQEDYEKSFSDELVGDPKLAARLQELTRNRKKLISITPVKPLAFDKDEEIETLDESSNSVIFVDNLSKDKTEEKLIKLESELNLLQQQYVAKPSDIILKRIEDIKSQMGDLELKDMENEMEALGFDMSVSGTKQKELNKEKPESIEKKIFDIKNKIKKLQLMQHDSLDKNLNSSEDINKQIDDLRKELSDLLIKQQKNKIKELQDKYDKSLDSNMIGDKNIELDLTKARIELKRLMNEKNKLKSNKEIPVQKEEPKVTIKEPSHPFDNLKIIFDGKNGRWNIKYLKSSEEKTEIYTLEKDLIFRNSNLNFDREIIEKYGIKASSEMDYNLYSILGEFDLKNNTKLQEQYAKNMLETDIVYDFRKYSNVPKQILNSKEKRQLKKIAKEQSEYRNAKVFNHNNKEARMEIDDKLKSSTTKKIIVGAAIGTAVATGAAIGAHNIKKELGNKDIPEITTENVTEQKVTTEEKNKVENIVEQETSKYKEPIGPEKFEADTVDEVNKENDVFGPEIVRLGQKLHLTDVKVGYDSMDSKPKVNIDNLPIDYTEISLVAVKKESVPIKVFEIDEKGKVISVSDRVNGRWVKQTVISNNDNISYSNINAIKERYKKLYNSDNIEIQINFNGYNLDTNSKWTNIGWVDSDDIKVKNENTQEKTAMRR